MPKKEIKLPSVVRRSGFLIWNISKYLLEEIPFVDLF